MQADRLHPTAFPWKGPLQSGEKKGGLSPQLRAVGPGYLHTG